MARKNLLAGLADTNDHDSMTSSYPMRGASKSMIRSVNELAKQADAYLQSEHVIALDPDVIDVSFIADRLGDDQEKYLELLKAIKERGQDTPILVRPHPEFDGRYMVVFGHRRFRAARELGIKVKAVIKVLDDKTHIIAQGQENSARANLSFIEKAAFAKNLEDLGYDRDTMSAALSANAAAISKMVSVTSRIPQHIIKQIGAAPAIGRERWLQLSLLVHNKSNEIAELLTDPHFETLHTNDRFERLFSCLNTKGKPVRKTLSKSTLKEWTPSDKSVNVVFSDKGKKQIIEMRHQNAKAFSEWLSENVTLLYENFKADTNNQTGN